MYDPTECDVRYDAEEGVYGFPVPASMGDLPSAFRLQYIRVWPGSLILHMSLAVSVR